MSPLKNRKPLRRKVRLRSGSALPKRNRKRGGHRFPKTVNRQYRAWIREQSCAIAGRFCVQGGIAWWQHRCRGETHGHHVRSRGAGGGDIGNMVALCASAHEQGHAVGWRSFEKAYSTDLSGVASALAARWKEEHPSE